MRADVLVVGAGPAGSCTSYMLSKEGLKVLMIDRLSQIGKRSCSGLLGNAALVELPVKDESMILSRLDWAEFLSPGGERIRLDGMVGFVVDRVRLDNELAELAVSEGTEFVKSTSFLELSGKSSCIVVGRAGRRAVDFKYLVGADGAASRVRGCIKPFPAPYVAVQISVPRKAVPEGGTAAQLRMGSRYSWAHPFGSEGRAGALSKLGEPVLDWARKMAGDGDGTGRIHGAMIPKEPPKRFAAGNIALVGDAAGQVKPLSRGGVLMGVRGAKELARAILRSHEGGSGRIGRSYEVNWWREFGNEIKISLGIRDSLDRSRPRELDALFRWIRELEQELSKQFDIDSQAETALKLISPRMKLLSARRAMSFLISNPRVASRAAINSIRWFLHYLLPL